MLSSLYELWEENKIAYTMLIPLVLFFALLMWYPLLQAIWMSLHKWVQWETVHPWVGVQNYVQFLTSEGFVYSMVATGVYFLGTFIQLGIALVIGLIVSQRFIRWKSFWLGVYILPYAIPPVVSGTIWLFLLQPNLGMINHYFEKLVGYPWYWTTSTWGARGVVTGALAWTFWPFMFLIILASLQRIPKAHYEASAVFGASWWQTVYRVILPQMKNSILVVFLIRTVWNLVKVSQVLQLTEGGPGLATSILPILMYQRAYQGADFGRASVIGMVLLGLIFILVFPLISRIQAIFRKAS